MKLTNLLRMKLPEGKDPVNVEDFNDNFKAIDKELEQMQTSAGDASKNTVTFSTAAERTNVASTETLGTLMGKIAKWFTDMKAAAFAGIANNETTNTDGFVLDARIGKKHSDQLNGLYFGTDAKGKWGFKTSQGGTITPFRNPTGNAAAADVLSGKVFSSAELEDATGSMPNNGAWIGETTGNGNVAIPAGYHSGAGYVSGEGAYNKGISDADGRVNEESASYKSGYANGVNAWMSGTTVDQTVCSGAGCGSALHNQTRGDKWSTSNSFHKAYSIPKTYNGGTLYALTFSVGKEYNEQYGSSASGSGVYKLTNSSGSTLSSATYTASSNSDDGKTINSTIDFMKTPYEVAGDSLTLDISVNTSAGVGTNGNSFGKAAIYFSFVAKYKVPA